MEKSNIVNQQFLLASRPRGLIVEENFKRVKSAVPTLADGECLIKVQYMGLEPAMRGWMENRADYIAPLAIGDVMRGFGAGVVVASNNSAYPVGARVTGGLGWQQYCVSNGGDNSLQIIAEEVSMTAALSVFGLTGMTAWFGLTRIGQPKKNDVFLVSSAAGATGSIAGQLARLMGCKVVGITSSDEKCNWLTGTLGFDAAVNYRQANWIEQLKTACDNGIDIYFDCAGGEQLDAALDLLRDNARVVLCGGISRYNATGELAGPANYFNLIFRRARMEGFIVLDHVDEFARAIETIKPWVLAGQLQHAETITDGFELLPKALIGLFCGQNRGKQLVRISSDADSAQ